MTISFAVQSRYVGNEREEGPLCTIGNDLKRAIDLLYGEPVPARNFASFLPRFPFSLSPKYCLVTRHLSPRLFSHICSKYRFESDRSTAFPGRRHRVDTALRNVFHFLMEAYPIGYSFALVFSQRSLPEGNREPTFNFQHFQSNVESRFLRERCQRPRER